MTVVPPPQPSSGAVKLTATDVVSILSALAGLVGTGLLATFGTAIDAIAPGWGTKVVALLTAVSYAAAIILRVLTNPSPPAGTVSTVQPAPPSTKGPTP